MPLTQKGTKIMHAMQKTYGTTKGKAVFYAAQNAGTIKGTHFEGASPHASWLEAHYARHGLGAIPQAVGGSPRANAMHNELAAMQRGMARGG